MCIAIRKPRNVEIDEATLRRCFIANPHGAGFVALVENKDGSTGLVIQKGFFTIESFLAAYKPYAKHFCLVHFRIATSGKRDKFNCHPWELRAGGHRYAIIHNGRLEHPSSETMSDTGHFVKEALRPVLEKHPDFPFTKGGHEALVKAIGPKNKLVILRDDGRVAIINKRKGITSNTVWYSNLTYLPRIELPRASRPVAPAKDECDDCSDETAATEWAKEDSQFLLTENSFPARVATDRVDEYLTHRPLGEGIAAARAAAREEAQQLALDRALKGPKVHKAYRLPAHLHLKP